jgi:hypothetical protein
MVMKRRNPIDAAAYKAGQEAADRLRDQLEPLLRAWHTLNDEEKKETMDVLNKRKQTN